MIKSFLPPLLLVCSLSGFGQGFDKYGGTLDLQCPARGAAGTGGYNITGTVTQFARTSNVATLTLSASLGANFVANDGIFVTGVSDTSFNTPAATVTYITVVAATTLSYANTGANVATTASGGTVTLARFYTAKISSRWWGCTPLGNAIFFQGVFQIARDASADYQGVNDSTLDSQKYNISGAGTSTTPQLNWGNQVAVRMKAWGFNLEGEYTEIIALPVNVDSTWNTSDQTMPTHLPFTQQFNEAFYGNRNLNNECNAPNSNQGCTEFAKGYAVGIKRSVGGMTSLGTYGLASPDPFDPNFKKFITGFLLNDSTILKWYQNPNNDFFVAFMSDDQDALAFAKGSMTYMTVRNGLLETSPGSTAPHYGYITAISSPVQSATYAGIDLNVLSAFNPVFVADTTFYAKQEMANWLQGSSAGAYGSNATSSTSGNGSTVTQTFSGAHPFVTNDIVTVTGCANTSFNSTAGTGLKVTSFTSTTITYSQSLSGSTTGCVVTSGPGYTLAGLNSAWSSSYSSFGSAATTNTETICASSCVAAQTYTTVNIPSPLTIQIKVGGTVMCGDDGSGPTAATVGTTGNFRGGGGYVSTGTVGNAAPATACTEGTSTVNYSTKVLTINFSSTPPSASAVTVTYRNGGWGTGFGFLDEDGTCPSRGVNPCWLPQPSLGAWDLSGSTATGAATVRTDLDNFLFHFAAQYFRTHKNAFNTNAPGVLYVGSTNLGAWGSPARSQVLQAAGALCDILSEGMIPPNLSDTDNQNRYNYVASNGGDKPWIEWIGFDAQADSYFSPYGTAGIDQVVAHAATQAARGTTFTTILNKWQTLSDATFSSSHIIGYRWWAWQDGRGETHNWGLVTRRDNPYDGRAATGNAGTDRWGFPSGCYGSSGCEQVCPSTTSCVGATKANYGNFIDSVQAGNSYWLNYVTRTLHKEQGAVNLAGGGKTQ